MTNPVFFLTPDRSHVAITFTRRQFELLRDLVTNGFGDGDFLQWVQDVYGAGAPVRETTHVVALVDTVHRHLEAQP